MSRIMSVPVFQIPKTQISPPFEDLEDTNSIFNLRLSFLGDKVSDSDNKRLLRNKEPELQFENLFDENSKKYNRRFRPNSKSCKPYVCRKKVVANSDDENFWRTAMTTHFSSVEDETRIWVSEEKEVQEMENLSKDCDSEDMEDMSEEIIFSGNITVTIKDKPVMETKEEILEILRKSFEAFKINAQESRRLRELKTKLQEKLAMKIMRRYFDAWRKRVSNLKVLEKRKKEEREISNERKIELFINAITEKQKQLKRLRKSTSSSPRSTKPGPSERCKSAPEEITADFGSSKSNFSKAPLRGLYNSNSQARFQVQRKIIEEQRFKLAQQNRIIEELRLKEIEREAKKAHRDTIDAAKGALAYCGRGTRRSLISLMKEQGCRDESAEPLRLPETPDFLIRMEARAEARRERVKKSEEARVKRIGEEKRREEEARKKEEIERKQLQLEAQKEAKRLREERIREAERTKFLNEKADHFYRHFLLRRYIFQPLFLLLIRKRDYLDKAIHHHNESLLRKTFLAWKFEIDQQQMIKEQLAISIHERNLLWSSFSDWRNYTSKERQKYHVASDFHDLKVQTKIFKIWWIQTLETKALDEENIQMARDHREMKLKMRFFNLWMRFPQISEKVKESERQKREWRELVQRVIPDFDPRHRGVAIDD